MNPKPRKFETRLTVSLTGRDYEALNALAEKDDVSASWLVRRAVEKYLRQRRKEIGPPSTTQAPAETRALDHQ
jgi:metal-responsive CopG/Arc/MetJ family transcriptional regulator